MRRKIIEFTLFKNAPDNEPSTCFIYRNVLYSYIQREELTGMKLLQNLFSTPKFLKAFLASDVMIFFQTIQLKKNNAWNVEN